jgi:hypothetical protein
MENLENIPVILPKERHPSQRLRLKLVLSMIAGKSTGWIIANLFFFNEIKTNNFPTNFASKNDEVFLQVVVRLVPRETLDENLKFGPKAFEVLYRYKKILVKKEEEKKTEENVDVSDTTVEDIISTKNVTKESEWVGTLLEKSKEAGEFLLLMDMIGKERVNRVLIKTYNLKQKEKTKITTNKPPRRRKSPF